VAVGALHEFCMLDDHGARNNCSASDSVLFRKQHSCKQVEVFAAEVTECTELAGLVLSGDSATFYLISRLSGSFAVCLIFSPLYAAHLRYNPARYASISRQWRYLANAPLNLASSQLPFVRR
jgi:hypothetical protein